MSASVTVRRGSGRGTTGAWRSPVQGSRSGMHAGLAGAPASESAAGDVRNAGGCGPGTVALPGAAIDPRRDDEPRPAGMWPAAGRRCATARGMRPAARRGGVPDPLACGPPRAGAVCQIPMRCRQRTSLTASCHVRGHARHVATAYRRETVARRRCATARAPRRCARFPWGVDNARPSRLPATSAAMSSTQRAPSTLVSRSSRARPMLRRRSERPDRHPETAEDLRTRHRARIWQGPPAACRRRAG